MLSVNLTKQSIVFMNEKDINKRMGGALISSAHMDILGKFLRIVK